jgi:hypothetical protein
MKHSTFLKTLLLGGFAVFAFNSCMTSTNDDAYVSNGENTFVKQESENMGQVVNNGSVSSGGLNKAAVTADVQAADSDTLTSDFVLIPLHFDDSCNCFVRTANFTASVGFERLRQDSLWLIDSSGDTLNTFHPGHAATVIHHRHVTRIRGTVGDTIDVQFNTTLTWTKSGDTVEGVWNGTITGTFNGVVFKNCTISNVIRPVVTGIFGFKHLAFPTAGTISFTKGDFNVVIQFTGQGTATVTATNSSNGKVRILHIDIYGTES